MRVYLTRVERSKTNETETVVYYNNLYVTFGQVVGKTTSGQFAIYVWSAIEIDPATGLEKIYDMNSIATLGDNIGSPVGEINDNQIGEINNNQNFFGRVIAKVSEVVPTSPGNEITI